MFVASQNCANLREKFVSPVFQGLYSNRLGLFIMRRYSSICRWNTRQGGQLCIYRCTGLFLCQNLPPTLWSLIKHFGCSTESKQKCYDTSIGIPRSKFWILELANRIAKKVENTSSIQPICYNKLASGWERDFVLQCLRCIAVLASLYTFDMFFMANMFLARHLVNPDGTHV